MKFTFGIITFDDQEERVSHIIEDIKEYSDDSEIIVVGGSNQYDPDIKHVRFDESVNSGWITRKKNIVTEIASNQNIVYAHDYYTINTTWQDGWDSFGNEWDVCMNVIKNVDGSRFRDWCAWDDPELCYFKQFFTGLQSDKEGHFACLAPYDYTKTKYMYISGGYWVAKKETMEKYPLDEKLMANQAEDVEWSKRMRPSCNYVLNKNVVIDLLKPKDIIIRTVEEIQKCREIYGANK